MRDRELLTLPEAQVIEDAEREVALLRDRAAGVASI
jgi:hypothetical protein